MSIAAAILASIIVVSISGGVAWLAIKGISVMLVRIFAEERERVARDRFAVAATPHRNLKQLVPLN